MIALWIAAAVLAGAAFGLIVLMAGHPVLAAADASRRIYQRQLGEIDDLVARGLLSEDERKATHAEAARRLLSQEDQAMETPPSKGVVTAAMAVAGLVALGALALYLAAGSPATKSQAYAARLKEWKTADPTSLSAPELVAVIQAGLKEKGESAEGLFFLAQVQGAANDFSSAERNLEKAIALDPARAAAWDLLGRTRVELAGGKVPPKAQQPFRKALELDPKLMLPRYFLAHADIDEGRVQQGVATLQALKAESPPEGQQVLEREIAQAEGRTLPAAAAPADPAIIAMVNGLAARLKDAPDDPAGWQRLVRSYSVLKDQSALDKALADARTYFKDRPADLAAIEAAAKPQGQ